MTHLLHNLATSLPLQGILAQTEQTTSGGGGAAVAIGGVIGLAITVFLIAGMWKMFVKAGKPGWACIVPFYNIIVLLQIVGKPIWWFILLFIPIVGFVIAILGVIALAKSFGKGAGFGIGIIFLGFIFIPILGFGDAKYIGPQP